MPPSRKTKMMRVHVDTHGRIKTAAFRANMSMLDWLDQLVSRATDRPDPRFEEPEKPPQPAPQPGPCSLCGVESTEPRRKHRLHFPTCSRYRRDRIPGE